MDFLKPTAEHVARYVRFWIGFLSPPAAVLRECRGSGVVQPELIVFVGIGILAAWLIGYAAGWLGVPDDPSALFRAAAGLGYDDIPVAGAVAAFATVFAAAVFHGLARMWSAFERITDRDQAAPDRPARVSPGWLAARPRLGGNVHDTINGALGFVAFFAPLAVLIVALALLAAAHTGIAGAWVAPAAGLALALAVLVYLPAAIAATHRDTGYFNVAWSLSVVVVAIALLIDAAA
jgi:hypothetical protein